MLPFFWIRPKWRLSETGFDGGFRTTPCGTKRARWVLNVRGSFPEVKRPEGHGRCFEPQGLRQSSFYQRIGGRWFQCTNLIQRA